MLETLGLSKEWWGEVILTARHVLNKVPTKNKEITPFEEWEKRKLNISYLRTWGCLAKVNVPINKKRKLGPKTVDCVFLGYTDFSKEAIRSEMDSIMSNATWEVVECPCWGLVLKCYELRTRQHEC
jgi:hypothetical protein